MIIEPFAGAAGYSLRYPDRQVVLFDVDSNIVRTWNYLIGVSEAEISGLPLLCRGDSLTDYDLTPEQALLLGWWVNPGSSQPKKTQGKYSGAWNARYRDRIAAQVSRIRHWRIMQAPYADAPAVKATWFVDPPYENAGRHYRRGSSGIDYAHLSLWCHTRFGQVIACENAGASWLPFRPWRDVRGNQSGTGIRVSKEVIWEHGSEAAE